MPITLEKLPNEPILIVTCSGRLDTPTMIGMFAETAALMGDEPVLYRVVDYHAVTTPFGNVLRAAQEASANHPQASTTDPRVKPVMVGGEAWLAEARRAFEGQPFGAVRIPMFNSAAEAVQAIRQKMKD